MSEGTYEKLGQIVYTSDENCFNGDSLSCTIGILGSGEKKQGGDEYYFEDRILTLNNSNFTVEQDYFYRFNVKQWLDEDVCVDILLGNKNTINKEYQFLKRVVIPKSSSSSSKSSSNTNFKVIIYREAEGESIQTDWVRSKKEEIPETEQGIYESDGTYYLKKPGSSDEIKLSLYQVRFFGDLTEKQNIAPESSYLIEGIFSPLQSDFDTICLRVVQTIYNYIEDGDQGRTVEPTGLGGESGLESSLKIYQLKNLLSPVKKAHKIGVWGNYGLRMAVNGEEIRIGPTGYYEMDLLPIYRLGIAPQWDSNNQNSSDFTVDYLYYDEAK